MGRWHAGPGDCLVAGDDPSEKWDVAKDHPDVVAELIQAAKEHKKTVQPTTN